MMKIDTKFESSILLLITDLTEKFLKESVNYPKFYKYTLVQTINNSINNLRILIIKALRIDKKLTALREADIEIENLKILIRVSYNLKCIGENQYGFWAENLVYLGKMIGGWKKKEIN